MSHESITNQAVQDITASGFAVLRSVLPESAITAVGSASKAFYGIAEDPGHPQFPRAYLYNPGNMATSMSALDDYGTDDFLLLRAVANSPVSGILRKLIGDDFVCSLTHSRLRKSYRQNPPDLPRPSTVEWHEDGCSAVGYYNALILWVPFTPCNNTYPGLEFQTTEGEVIRPDLDIGDALLFNDKVLHRTADCPTSTQDRYSCDVRFFKRTDIPDRVHEKIAQDSLLCVRAFAEQPW